MMSRLVAAAGGALLSVLMLVAMLAPATAAELWLAEFLGKIKPADLVAGADRFGAPEGTPPVAPVFQGDRLLGFAYLNSDVVELNRLFGQADPHPRRHRSRRQAHRRQAGRASRADRARRHSRGEDRAPSSTLRRHRHPRHSPPADGGSRRARHRQRRHRDRAGDRRQHPALGAEGARRRAASASRPPRSPARRRP